MYKNISLTLAGLIFSVVIAVVYFKKKKYQDVENNIYRFLLIWTIGLLLLEITCDIIISYRFELPVLTQLLCRLYILGDVVWFVFVIGYMKVLLSPNTYKNIRDLFGSGTMLFISTFASVSFFISCFLPIKYTSGNNGELNVIGGQAVYALYVVFAFVGAYMVKALFKNISKATIIKRLPIFMFLILYAVLGIFQLLYADINDLTFLFGICIVSIYFTLENQDEKLVEELEVAREKAELADRSKTQFLSKMSHEIRTPMNAIMGFSETLLSKNKLTAKETKEDVQNIYSAGKSLLEIINNILLFSKIESGSEELEEIEYSLSEITFEVDSFVKAKIDSKKVNYSLIISDKTPLNFIGDKAKISKILINILSNSLNYTQNGKIELKIDYDKLEDDLVMLKFTIKDTGQGMLKEELEKLKNNLYKTEEEETNINLMGLGLLIVEKLTKILDAKIDVSSEYGIGTTVSIELKQKVVGDKTFKDFKKEYSKENKNIFFDCSKYKILVVDDNKLNRKVIEKLLSSYKAKVDLCDNGNECIEKIKNGGSYDLIMLDHLMPDLDGIETLRVLKKINKQINTPIIAMTANSSKEIRETFISNGFSDYLSKPIDTRELNKILIKYLKKDRG